MPAESSKQAHTAQVTMGIKTGKVDPKSLPPRLRKAALSMAEMEEGALSEYMHMQRPAKKSLLHGGA